MLSSVKLPIFARPSLSGRSLSQGLVAPVDHGQMPAGSVEKAATFRGAPEVSKWGPGLVPRVL